MIFCILKVLWSALEGIYSVIDFWPKTLNSPWRQALIRAKFVCNAVTQFINDQARIHLIPVMTGSEENKAFWQHTPSGQIEMTINNPTAIEQFTPGAEYYVTFAPASREAGEEG